MSDNFFPSEDYKIPSTSNYMKFLDGKNKFRVLSSAIVGYEYWNTQNKPVRSRVPFDEMPDDIKLDKEGNGRINHFWAFVVYNYEAKRIQVLEITQKSVMNAIKAYIDNEAWGNPKGYDIVVSRSGSALTTEYQVIANPHTALNEEVKVQYEGKKINLEALFTNGDPFTN